MSTNLCYNYYYHSSDNIFKNVHGLYCLFVSSFVWLVFCCSSAFAFLKIVKSS